VTLLAELLHLFKHIIVNNALVGIGENRLLFNGIIPLLLIPDRIGVSLEVHRAACVLPAFQNRHNGTAAVHPDAGRICNTASEAASAAILYRNTDRADGFACHPHRRDAFRLRRNTGHRLKAPQEQLSAASVLGVRCCVLCPAGGIGLRRSYYSTKPVPVKLIRALLCSAFIRPPNANNTVSARSREAHCRLSAPALACLFIFRYFPPCPAGRSYSAG